MGGGINNFIPSSLSNLPPYYIIDTQAHPHSGRVPFVLPIHDQNFLTHRLIFSLL